MSSTCTSRTGICGVGAMVATLMTLAFDANHSRSALCPLLTFLPDLVPSSCSSACCCSEDRGVV
eukprot:3368321-Rhodomonas_salina.1